MGLLINRLAQVMPRKIKTLFEVPVTTLSSSAARTPAKAHTTPNDSPLMARFCQQIGSPSSVSGWELPLIESYLDDEPDTASNATFSENIDADVPLHLRGGDGEIIYEDDSPSNSDSPHYSSSYFPSASGESSARSILDTRLFQFPPISSPSPSPSDFYPIPHLHHHNNCHRDHDIELDLPSPPNHGPRNTAFCRAHFGTFPMFAPFPTFSFSHLLTDPIYKEPQPRLKFVFGIGREAEFTFMFPHLENAPEEVILLEEASPVQSLLEESNESNKSNKSNMSKVSEQIPLNPLRSNPVLASQFRFRLQSSRPVRPFIHARRGAKSPQILRRDCN